MTTIERPTTIVLPADWVPGPKQGEWTYADYAALPDDGRRYEVVNGVLYMAPSPTVGHQRIAFDIATHLRNFVETAGLGEVFIAPLDVELRYKYVVQPDTFVVLNEHLDRVIKSRIIGAPDLVVEVASPGTARHDLREKQDSYALAGVPEYWIVTPDAKIVEVLTLEHGAYRSCGIFCAADLLPSKVLPGFPAKVEQFFAK